MTQEQFLTLIKVLENIAEMLERIGDRLDQDYGK